jgi:hypothetical protein
MPTAKSTTLPELTDNIVQQIYAAGVPQGKQNRLVWVPDNNGEAQRHVVSAYQNEGWREVRNLYGKPSEKVPDQKM